ncbi:hypothetical protein AB0H77_35215 [Streptomyces sp. NPDC050844]|uniref:hypothetical protein n=1 Tax=Streptomyces sp. NPDC050844 TaxID=3155790 RepID=UPI0033FCD913
MGDETGRIEPARGGVPIPWWRDFKETLLRTHLSSVLLGGLVRNATLGWSWADPIVALVIAATRKMCDSGRH